MGLSPPGKVQPFEVWFCFPGLAGVTSQPWELSPTTAASQGPVSGRDAVCGCLASSTHRHRRSVLSPSPPPEVLPHLPARGGPSLASPLLCPLLQVYGEVHSVGFDAAPSRGTARLCRQLAVCP